MLTEKNAAVLISDLLACVRSVLAMLPAESELRQIDPIMVDLIEKLKTPGGGIKIC